MKRKKAEFIAGVWRKYGVLIDFDGEPGTWTVPQPGSRPRGAPTTWGQFVGHVLGDGVESVRVIQAVEPPTTGRLLTLRKKSSGQSLVMAIARAVSKPAVPEVAELVRKQKEKTESRWKAKALAADAKASAVRQRLRAELSRVTARCEAAEAALGLKKARNTRRRLTEHGAALDNYVRSELETLADGLNEPEQARVRAWLTEQLEKPSNEKMTSTEWLALLLHRMIVVSRP